MTRVNLEGKGYLVDTFPSQVIMQEIGGMQEIGSLSLLSYTSQAHLLRDEAAHSGLGTSLAIVHRECVPEVCLQAI